MAWPAPHFTELQDLGRFEFYFSENYEGSKLIMCMSSIWASQWLLLRTEKSTYPRHQHHQPFASSLTPRISKGHLKKKVGFGTASFAGREQDRACHPVSTQQGGSLQSTFLGFWESTALIRPAPHWGDLHREENSAHGCASAVRCYRDSSGQWGWCPFD